MNPDDLIGLLRAQPFIPFTVHLNNGAEFEIRHPDQAMILGEVFLLAHKGTELIRCAMLNIVHVKTSETEERV